MFGRIIAINIVQVPDVTLYEMQPCPPDFTSYLEATHSCVAGEFMNDFFGQSNGFKQ